MSLNPKQIAAFVHVAELQSFRRAAERLNTTQPNISSRVAALEERLGVTLMERDAGSVRLTARGEALLPHARRVLAAMQDFLAAVGDNALFEGTIRLGVTDMIVHTWLAAYLTALKTRYPNVIVELTVDLSAKLTTMLRSRSIDLAIQTGPFDTATSGEVDLGRYPMVWTAAPGLGLPAGSLTAADIAAHPILTHARGTKPFQEIAAHFHGAGVHARIMPSMNMSPCLQMTKDGLGIACMPQAMVAGEIEAGHLVALDYGWAPEALTFAARYNSDTTEPTVAEAARIALSLSQQCIEDNENPS
ncbi:LysR family transcriptional regulator [Acuticoccus kandeliae]|uniref:LysR family transcriptional regulator n=1 Tax=Acuticoccus kandeliae TaxID=2073160 RepID=UPI000D3EC508|nr:LysR family transcriptional regulator [Acuticoccus kandeliae]